MQNSGKRVVGNMCSKYISDLDICTARRSTTEVHEQHAAKSGAGGNGNGAAPDQATERELRRSASEARMAVAAKISAARALARKLCEEKEAAMAAARAAAEHSLDEEEIERCILRPATIKLLDVLQIRVRKMLVPSLTPGSGCCQ